MERTKMEELDILSEYKKTAYKLGVFLALLFFMRIPAGLAINALYSFGEDVLSGEALFNLNLIISLLFIQILPSVIGAAMFGYFSDKGRFLKAAYIKPKNMKKAVGNFPEVYGIGQTVNFLTIAVMYIITSDSDLNSSLNPVTAMHAPTTLSLVVMIADAAIIAPIFEEFVFRGVVLRSLKPYGTGLSIFFSGIVFGLFHGNLSQCFFAAAVGIALGYIANVTDSLLPTTVLHIMLNSTSMILMAFLYTPSIQNYILSGTNEEIPDGDMLVITIFAICLISFIILAFIGFILAVVKTRKILKSHVPAVWTEVGNGKKLKMLIVTPIMMIAILLLVENFTGDLTNFIIKLFAPGN